MLSIFVSPSTISTSYLISLVLTVFDINDNIDITNMNNQDLDSLTRLYTSFLSFEQLLKANYSPSLVPHQYSTQYDIVRIAVLADAFDQAMTALGKPYRAWRGGEQPPATEAQAEQLLARVHELLDAEPELSLKEQVQVLLMAAIELEKHENRHPLRGSSGPKIQCDLLLEKVRELSDKSRLSSERKIRVLLTAVVKVEESRRHFGQSYTELFLIKVYDVLRGLKKHAASVQRFLPRRQA